jgi:drug/metabolite transporter (DMT)-like permease
LYSIFSRVALRRYDPLTITFYTFVMGAVAGALLGNPGNIVTAVACNEQVLWLCLALGVLCTILPYLLYTTGLRGMETSRAAILVTVEPLVGALIGIFVYDESTDPLKLIGMCLIFAAIVILNVRSSSAEEAKAAAR